MSGLRSPYTTPTEEQAALVGHIVMDWAIAGWLLRVLAARLACAPEFPARALTERASDPTLIKACRALLDLHGDRYNNRFISADHALAVRAALKRMDELRDDRNEFAHHIGWREHDDAFVLTKLTSLGARPKLLSSVELRSLRDRIRAASESLDAAISLVPAVPEAPEEEPRRKG